MTGTGESAKADLQRYLQQGRDALLWKLDGLSEYDVRRPMTPTGTNLLGVVKHVASCEAWYLGDTFGRRTPTRRSTHMTSTPRAPCRGGRRSAGR
jgi:hypothetical protein